MGQRKRLFKMNVSQRIYYISQCKDIKPYMTKTKFLRVFTMKSLSQKKFLPKKTQKLVDELIKYNCQIKYTIK